MSWSGRRRVIYAVTTLVISIVGVTFVWLQFFNAPPTCFDKKQNGTEQGIDCGGSCTLVCTQLAGAPRVLWARAFQNGASNIYTLTAYIENPNPSAGAKGVEYIFQLYDADNKLIIEKRGTADLPPVQTIPIVEPTVDVGNRIVAHTEFSFNSKTQPVWSKALPGSIPMLRVSRQQLSPDGSRLDVTIDNTGISDATNVTLVAILYDTQGVARAASKSVVPAIAHKATEEVTFTWPMSNLHVARTEITLLPSF